METEWQAGSEAAPRTRHLQQEGRWGYARAYGKCPPPLSVSIYRGRPHINLIIIGRCKSKRGVLSVRVKQKDLQVNQCICSGPRNWDPSYEESSDSISWTVCDQDICCIVFRLFVCLFVSSNSERDSVYCHKTNSKSWYLKYVTGKYMKLLLEKWMTGYEE